MDRVVLVRRPVSPQELQRELEELFQRQWGRPRPASLRHEESFWQPEVDVYEVAEAYIVLVELAGMRDSPIEVTMAGEGLLIEGRRPELHREGTLRFHQLGINEGRFQAAVLLPGPVDETGIKAEYEDGLLTITLLKRWPQVRRIEVSSQR